MVMINESNLLNIVFVYAILHAIMGSGPQIRVADNEWMIDPKALFSPKLNYACQQHGRDSKAEQQPFSRAWDPNFNLVQKNV